MKQEKEKNLSILLSLIVSVSELCEVKQVHKKFFLNGLNCSLCSLLPSPQSSRNLSR